MRATIAMATTAKMPAHWCWQRHHDEGNDSSATSDEGLDASSTMAETHLRINDSNYTIVREQQSLLQQQRRCLRINGKDAITTRARTPAWRRVARATTHACTHTQMAMAMAAATTTGMATVTVIPIATATGTAKVTDTASATATAKATSEVQSKMIFMGHQISSCHVPVVRSFSILWKMLLSSHNFPYDHLP